MANKKKKRRIKPVPVAITAGVFIMLVILSAVAITNAKNKNKKDDKANVNISKTDLTVEEVSTEPRVEVDDTEVEILFEDTAAVVGTVFKVTALVIPDDTEEGLTWSSSNSDVFTVDVNGVVTIKGIGTATLTATVGNVSDAVVIEGIKTITSGSSNDLPLYIAGGTGGSDSGNSGSSSGNDGTGTTGSGSSGSGNSNSGSGNTGNNGAGNSSSGNTGGSDSGSSGSGNAGGTGSGSSDAGNTASGNSGNAGGANTGSTGGSGAGATSGEISEVITGNGFSQTVSNVYVCQENGTYYGEIITQNNVTIFYIKQRSDTFDSRIKSVVESLLPGNSGTVWNNYLSANTDRTFQIDGRTVRIVVATGGGHSQIVIYN